MLSALEKSIGRQDGENAGSGSQTTTFSKNYDVLCFCQVLKKKGNVLLRFYIVPAVQIEWCLWEQTLWQGQSLTLNKQLLAGAHVRPTFAHKLLNSSKKEYLNPWNGSGHEAG